MRISEEKNCKLSIRHPNAATTDRSCWAGLVALLQLGKVTLLLRVGCAPLASFCPETITDLHWQFINTSFAEDRATGSSLFRRRALSFFRALLFFFSFAFFSWPRFWLSVLLLALAIGHFNFNLNNILSYPKCFWREEGLTSALFHSLAFYSLRYIGHSSKISFCQVLVSPI